MINIELVYARNQDHQIYTRLVVCESDTIQQVIEKSNILVECPEIQFESDSAQICHSVGIWYKAANLTDGLKEGDRIEIYRPLYLSAMAAREARKQDAKLRYNPQKSQKPPHL